MQKNLSACLTQYLERLNLMIQQNETMITLNNFRTQSWSKYSPKSCSRAMARYDFRIILSTKSGFHLKSETVKSWSQNAVPTPYFQFSKKKNVSKRTSSKCFKSRLNNRGTFFRTRFSSKRMLSTVKNCQEVESSVQWSFP